jgi:digeranylgeranylglycerophospholipid reductase
MTEIAVVGAGPAGLLSAYLLAKNGLTVKVYEEHRTIGQPVQCTGIVTKALEKNVVRIPEDVIVNRIRKARIHAIGRTTELDIDDIVLDRAAFDNYLLELAESEGVKVIRNTKVDSVLLESGESEKPGLQIGNGIVAYDKVIGADGPFSITRAAVDPGCNIDFYTGKQALVRGTFEEGIFDVYLGSIAKGFFAWVVPQDRKAARVGLASIGNPNQGFIELMKICGLSEKDIVEYQSGMIPVYNPKLITESWPVYLVGDAAAQVKATTGGGLVPGLRSARILADSILGQKSYASCWKKTVGRDLWIDLKVRKMLEKFDDKEYSSLIRLISSKRVKNTLSRYERDSPVPLLASLALKEPRLIKYGFMLLSQG